MVIDKLPVPDDIARLSDALSDYLREICASLGVPAEFLDAK